MIDLATLDYDKFKTAVLEEVRQQSHGKHGSRHGRLHLDTLREELQKPDVVLRWIIVLNQLKASSERQLGQRKAQDRVDRLTLDPDDYQEQLLEYLRWRISTLRFLIGLEDRLAIARVARLRHFPEPFVIDAVKAHRDATLGANLAPSDADMDLWSLLEEGAR